MLLTLWSRIKENTMLAASGGRWARAASPDTQKNLRWFFLDGVMGAGLDGIVGPFFSLYMLALGATSSLIGQMTSLSGLFATLTLLPGAMVSERTGKRKLIFVLCGAGFARTTILISTLLPFIFPASTAIYIIIALKVFADGLGNFSGPAWTSLSGDIVPTEWRGRYFGARNLFMTVSSMAAAYLAGLLIAHFTTISGYQLAFTLAFLTGMASTLLFIQIKEPAIQPAAPPHNAYSLKSVLQTIVVDKRFRNYVFFGIIWNFALGLGGPYFTIFFVQVLKATPTNVSFLSIVGGLAAIPGLRLFGRLSDSWGAWKVLLFTGLVLPILPLCWIIASAPIHGIMINIPGAIFWAGFNLASFNILLSLAPSEKRARYAALFQMAAVLSSAAGTFTGSLIITQWGYYPLFALCGFGRLVGILYFIRFVHEKIEDRANVMPHPADTI